MHIHKKKMEGDVTRARRRKIHVQDFPRQVATGPPDVGRKRTCVRYVGEAASRPTWARRRLRSRVRAVLGPENKSLGSY